MLLAHADWGRADNKRWMAQATLAPGRCPRLDATTPVGDAPKLAARLRAQAGADATLFLGFDFPLGIPIAYAQRAGLHSFPALLRSLAEQPAPAMFEVANSADEISLARPFYPHRSVAGVRRRELVEGLGLDHFDQLYRVCEGIDGMPDAAPLFWTLGSKQVGKAAISGWREVLCTSPEAKLWPFDGPLETLLAGPNLVFAETYPALVYRLYALDIATRGSKRRQADRIANTPRLLEVCRELELELDPRLRLELDEGFGDRPDGEDRFDAFVGLLGMLGVVLGRFEPAPPPTLRPELLAVEGWILGRSEFP